MTSDQRVKVDATGLYTSPDVVVLCGKAVFEDGVHYSAINPLALAEVLTAVTDLAGSVEFESLGISVPVREIYAGVEFPPIARCQ